MSMISPAPLQSPARPMRAKTSAFAVLDCLARARGGNVGILFIAVFPALIAFGLVCVDGAYLYFRNLLLHQTVQAAALAAGNRLTSYYTSGTNSTAAIVTAAQTFGTANMPAAQYGTVISAGNVVVGNWDSTTGAFTSLTASGGTSPNAVRVTGINSTANSNSVALFFGGILGQPTKDLTTAAIASYGTGQAFNTLVVSDLSGSFAPSIANQQAAASAILDCVADASPATSNFGIVGFNGRSSMPLPPGLAKQNRASYRNVIGQLKACTQPGGPPCGGSNAASGIYAAIQEFSNPRYANTRKNMIVITDGVPNANAVIYTAAEGIYPTPTSPTPTCTNTCTDADLWTMTQNQAAVARAAGISVSTIYYSGGTNGPDQAAYATALATLTGGTGVAMVAPSSARITSTFAGFCATMSSALKSVM